MCVYISATRQVSGDAQPGRRSAKTDSSQCLSFSIECDDSMCGSKQDGRAVEIEADKGAVDGRCSGRRPWAEARDVKRSDGPISRKELVNADGQRDVAGCIGR